MYVDINTSDKFFLIVFVSCFHRTSGGMNVTCAPYRRQEGPHRPSQHQWWNMIGRQGLDGKAPPGRYPEHPCIWRGTPTSAPVITLQQINSAFSLSYVCVWLKCPERFSGSRDLLSVLWWDQDYLWCWKWQTLSFLCGDCITAICRRPHPGDSTNRRDFPPEALWLSRKEDKKCCRWEAEKVSQLSGPGSYATHLPMKLCIVIIIIICILI